MRIRIHMSQMSMQNIQTSIRRSKGMGPRHRRRIRPTWSWSRRRKQHRRRREVNGRPRLSWHLFAWVIRNWPFNAYWKILKPFSQIAVFLAAIDTVSAESVFYRRSPTLIRTDHHHYRLTHNHRTFCFFASRLYVDRISLPISSSRIDPIVGEIQ